MNLNCLFSKRFVGFLNSVIIILVSFTVHFAIEQAFGAYARAPVSPSGPTVADNSLTVEKVTEGLDFPTSMAFLGPDDILITEKNTGMVKRVLDGEIQDTPLIDVPVATAIERGLLGIAIANSPQGITHVFVYYTESGDEEDGSDIESLVDPSGNRLYRYDYVDGQFANPVLLLDLTATPPNGRGEHNGGKIVIGPDNIVYLAVGEVGGHLNQATNIQDGPPPNGLGGVLRITQDGNSANPDSPIFGEDLPLNIYYAMGIRNSFGMDFDPLTGNLWDTENGPTFGDEINLVFPGFNSGWHPIQGFISDELMGRGDSEEDLVSIGNSEYADPKFVWTLPIGVTALKFLDSDKLGENYANNMFVGDINNGLLYRFTLNEARDAISINDTYSGNVNLLLDNKIDDPKENLPLIFGQGFGGITDIQVGPDGYLYVLSHTGSLYRIVPLSESTVLQDQGNSTASQTDTSSSSSQSVPAVILGINGSESYSPEPIEIAVGETITWYNGDSISHTVTSGQAGDPEDGSLFDSDAIIPYQSYSLTFDEVGNFGYYCIYHPTMVGEVIVNEDDAEDNIQNESSEDDTDEDNDEDDEDDEDDNVN